MLMSLIRYATRIHFAVRVLEDALPEELRARDIRAPLIVLDEDGAASLSLVLDTLPLRVEPKVLTLDSTRRPEELDRDLQAAMLPADGAAPDALIGLGGKTALDLVRLPQPPALPRRPVCTIATLPGSVGLSATAAAACVGGRYTGQQLVPDVVFCDPTLLHNAAPEKLAVAGMDSVVHCLEALLSDAWNPPADAMAHDGLWRAGQWLEKLVCDPKDPDASREAMAAALNGELASQKGAGALHALAHAFERSRKTLRDHGMYHGALIAAVVEFNAPAVPDQMLRAADALRLPDARDLGQWLAGFAARLGLPQSLRRLTMTSHDIRRLADDAASDYANRDNPRLATSADYSAMIQAALQAPEFAL
jgi:4-hydroxybutyrate dehydrogenase